MLRVHQYSPTGAFDEEVYDTARIIGTIFPEAKEKADAWIKEVQDTIKDIESKVQKTEEKKTVYYVNGEKAKGLYYSDGGNSMISRIYDVCNVALATEKYEVLNVHKVSDEEMINLNPYAMMIGGTYQNNLAESLSNSPIWSSLECNTHNRIYRIPVCMVGIENVCAETSLMLKYTASLFSDYEFDVKTEMRSCCKCLNILLQVTLQRSCTIYWIITMLNNILLCILCQRNRQLTIFKTIIDICYH